MPKQIIFEGQTHTFPDDFTDADIEAALSGAETPNAEGGGMLSTIADALPTVGGMVGSMAGGTPGAAIGGAAGAGYRSLMKNAGQLPGVIADVGRNFMEQPGATMRGFGQGAMEGAADAGVAGAIQGAVDAAGNFIIRPLAKTAYGVAMRPVKALRDKYGLKTLINEGFERGIMPTTGGAQKAMAGVQASKAAQEGMETAFDAAGGQLPSTLRTVREAVAPVVQRARAQELAAGVSPGGRLGVVEAAKRVATQNPSQMTATAMGAAKRAADDVADPAYKLARAMRQSVPETSEAGIAKAFSKQYRNTLANAIGPAYAKQGQTTKALFGVGRMAEEAAGRPEMLSTILSVASGATSYDDPVEALRRGLVTRALLSPRVQAGAAFAATPLASYGLRGLDAAFGAPVENSVRAALLAELAKRGGD